MHSKGRAGNGLWGCKVRLSRGALAPRKFQIEPDQKTRITTPRQDELPIQLVVVQGERVYFDAIYLAALNNELSDILTPEDDLRVCHRSLGQGQIVGVRTREGREALLKVIFADDPDGAGEYSAGTFASDFFRGEARLASVKIEAYEKYRQCLSTARLERIEDARAGMLKMTTSLSGTWKSTFQPYTSWMEPNISDAEREEQRLEREDAYREQDEAGFDWYDFHKHD
jgi:hypothetical protein